MANNTGNLKDKSNNTLYPIGIQKAFVLYESTTGGTTGTVTLNDNLANYFKIEILIYLSDGQDWSTYTILNPNGKKWNYNRAEANVNNGQSYIAAKEYFLNGNTITPTGVNFGTYRVDTGGMSSYDNTFIIMVVGYKR